MINAIKMPFFNSQPSLTFDKRKILSLKTVLISKPRNFRQRMTVNSFKFVVSARAVFQDKAKGVRTSGRAGARVGCYVKQRHTFTQLLEEPTVCIFRPEQVGPKRRCIYYGPLNIQQTVLCNYHRENLKSHKLDTTYDVRI